MASNYSSDNALNPSILHQDSTSYGWSLPSSKTLATLFLIYLALVQFLRFRRSRQITAYVRAHQPLTPAAAQCVVHDIAQLEFPFMHLKALDFALFRTYGIPTISALLKKTSLFSAPATAGRRYVDTEVLISEFVARTYGSTEWVVPMARLNAIHGHYRDKGQIIEADMLYTILLFAQQVPKWVSRYEWREMTHEECDAFGVFWQGISEAMEINYEGLGLRGWVEDHGMPMTANGRGKKAWIDGADWINAVDEWAERYEEKHMLPAESNKAVAEQTVALLLYEVPSFLHPFGKHVVSSLMDDRLRRATSIAPPPAWISTLVMTILSIRRLALRWLLLPRPNFLKVVTITELHEATKEGKHHMLDYANYPYYVTPTLGNRWGPRAWLRWSAGMPLPGDEGMVAEGYDPATAGPAVGRAKAEQSKRVQRVEEVLVGRGCPMGFTC